MPLAVHVVEDHGQSTEELPAALAAKHIHSVQWRPHALPLSLRLSLAVGVRWAANINNTPPPDPACPHSPADERRDDDAPGRAAAVGVGLLVALAPPAAQEDGIEEQEEKVQGQTGQRHAAQ